jgi:molybdopterin/thiamine biosynthesis adenylyltransferase/rhodanese-related sulfurtransferase
MAVSGSEYVRRVKERIDEVDPSEVRELAGEGVALIDVRETEEWDIGHLPGAKHVPRGYLESRIDAAVPDRSQRVILYCASGNRSALAANTLEELGFEHVESMTGGITLWKDRGYPVEVPKSFTPEQRDRYSRHFLLPEVGVEGQQKLMEAKVLLLGAGGLGSPTALYLAAAGVGTLGIVDDDVVDVSNLQRQVIHTTDRVGVPKVDSAAILGFEGQLSVFAPYEGPCYRCLFRQPPPAELAPSCGANGVLGVLPGTMGLLQATEVVKLVIGAGEPLIGRLLMYDALAATTTELKVRRDPECPICSREPDAISDDEMGVFPDYEAFCAAAG